ncbi:alpha/beta fold hydrolase [Roseateles sp. UC29_93]|uniref:alpha/beta fold hydrolase n=1 Tax=Roseateles sp. UC29_93 TaxID=3350177 RepID=UPI00366C4B7A
MITNEIDLSGGASRRRLLIGSGTTALAAAALTMAAAHGASAAGGSGSSQSSGGAAGSSSYITTKDGVQLYYKDWGPKTGQPIVFSHGWPLSSDSWDAQMVYFADRGFRVVAHDRRGHGRSSQPWDGHDMDHYADDLAAVVEALDLRNAVHVGFSTGGGEVARYIGRHGTKRVARIALISAVPPLMAKGPTNPDGVPIAAFDESRAALLKNRAQFFKDVPSGPFYGFNRPGAKPSQGMIDYWWLQGMQGSHKAVYDSIKAFSETDFREDLKKFDKPTLVVHGDDDQVVPIDVGGRRTAQLVKGAKLIVYTDAPHGLAETHADRLNADLLSFIQS